MTESQVTSVTPIWITRDPEADQVDDGVYNTSDYIAFWTAKPVLSNDGIGDLYQEPDEGKDGSYLGGFSIKEASRFFGISLETGEIRRVVLSGTIVPFEE